MTGGILAPISKLLHNGYGLTPKDPSLRDFQATQYHKLYPSSLAPVWEPTLLIQQDLKLQPYSCLLPLLDHSTHPTTQSQPDQVRACLTSLPCFGHCPRVAVTKLRQDSQYPPRHSWLPLCYSYQLTFWQYFSDLPENSSNHVSTACRVKSKCSGPCTPCQPHLLLHLTSYTLWHSQAYRFSVPCAPLQTFPGSCFCSVFSVRTPILSLLMCICISNACSLLGSVLISFSILTRLTLRPTLRYYYYYHPYFKDGETDLQS